MLSTVKNLLVTNKLKKFTNVCSQLFHRECLHLKGIPQIRTQGNLLKQVASTKNLQQAFDWLAMQSTNTHANHEYWVLSREWLTKHDLIQQQLLSDSYQFDTVNKIVTTDESGNITYKECRTCQDRIVVRAIAQVLQPIFSEQLSGHCMHLKASQNKTRGGLKEAVEQTKEYIEQHPDAFVIKSDVKRYYASINHTLLQHQLSTLLPDEKPLLRLLWQSFHRTLEFADTFEDIEQGIPLGSSLSPLLGALYLSPSDALAQSSDGTFYRRYMDDWVWVLPTRHGLKKHLKQHYAVLQALAVLPHPDKTFIGKCAKGFDFLGYHCCPIGLTLANSTLSRHEDKLNWLHEQGASKKRIGQYRPRWLGWVLAGIVPACFGSIMDIENETTLNPIYGDDKPCSYNSHCTRLVK